MKEGLKFFSSLKKCQSGIIRKGGTINTLTVVTNNHTSGTKQQRAESRIVSLKSKTKKYLLSWNYLSFYFFLNVNIKAAPVKLNTMLSLHLICITFHFNVLFTHTNCSPRRACPSGRWTCLAYCSWSPGNWKLFGVSYPNQILTLIFQRLIGLYSCLLCQQGPRKS